MEKQDSNIFDIEHRLEKNVKPLLPDIGKADAEELKRLFYEAINAAYNLGYRKGRAHEQRLSSLFDTSRFTT